jgi:hypothetical protein
VRLKKTQMKREKKWATHDDWEYYLFFTLLTTPIDIKIPEYGDTDFEETI